MWLHAVLPRPPVGQTPYEVVHTHDKLSVRHYASRGDGRCAWPVVIVPSMINRSYILDLEPDRSLVAALAALGHDVYLVDWGDPGPEDADEDVAYVLFDLLERALDRACRHHGAKKALVLGYCQGGTLAAMLAALRPGRFGGLALLNAPFQFSEGGRFRQLVDPKTFDVEQAFPEGLVPLEAMQAGFKLLDPMGNLTKFLAVDDANGDAATMARVLARERWLEENVTMASAFAREFVRNAYQEDRLMDASWVVGGERVDLKKVTAPVLVVAAQSDFITPLAAALPVADAVGSTDVTTKVIPTGHIGCVVGSAAAKHLIPVLDGWFRRVGGS